MNPIKSILLTLLLFLLPALSSSHAVQLHWAQGPNNVEVTFTMTEPGPVTVVAAFVGDGANLIGISLAQAQVEVKLDGAAFLTPPARLTVKNSGALSASGTFRKEDVPAGEHTVSMPTTIDVGFDDAVKTLLVILEDEPGDLAQQVDAISTQLSDEIAARQVADQQVRDDLTAMLQALETLLTQEVTSLQSTVTTLQTQIENNAGDVEALTTQIEQLETQITNLEQVYEQRVTKLEVQITQLGDNGSLVRRIQQLESREYPKDDDGPVDYLIPAGIGLGSSILVNLLWPDGEEDAAAAEAASDEDRPGAESE